MAGWVTAGSGVAVAHDEDPWQEQVPWEAPFSGSATVSRIEVTARSLRSRSCRSKPALAVLRDRRRPLPSKSGRYGVPGGGGRWRGRPPPPACDYSMVEYTQQVMVGQMYS
jgi:hypothetical protein